MDEENIKKIAKEASNELKIQLKKYGLTRIEYDILLMFEKMKSQDIEHKIMAQDSINNFLPDILKNIFKP